jgi:alginate O-acetyltransferase complex protein AlgI
LLENVALRVKPEDLCVGFTLFAIGLAKKVLLADSVAPAADAGFAHPEQMTLFAAWGASIAFSLQVYVDFSGYSDMAIGLARMIGIHFPVNFDSPFKSTSIIEYWQRWHMTLTRYLTAYLYNPIATKIMSWRMAHDYGISRRDMRTPGGFATMVATPMFYTMGLIGIWHGAGIQFLIFGLLHGLYLSINHAWREWTIDRTGNRDRAESSLVGTAGYVLLTYAAVVIALIFFRARSAGSAMTMLAGMAGLHGVTFAVPLPGFVIAALGTVAAPLVQDGIISGDHDVLKTTVLLVLLIAVVWTMPNSQEMLARFSPVLGNVETPRFRFLEWWPSAVWGVVIAFAFSWAVGALNNTSQFVYFQF